MNNIKGIILFFFLATSSVFSQTGLQFYAGGISATNRDINITPSGYAHSGYHFGMDARLNEGSMYFGGGMEFANIEFISQQNKSYFSVKNSMTWFKLRVGLGYKIFSLGDKMILRGKTYGSINMITNYPQGMTDVPYTNYNTGTAGAVFGLGVDLFGITLDFEYERGFFNAVNMVKGTEFDFYKLNVGFKI